MVTGNVEDEDVQNKLVLGTIEHFGRLDILVSNAGIFYLGNFEQAKKENLQEMFEVQYIPGSSIHILKSKVVDSSPSD